MAQETNPRACNFMIMDFETGGLDPKKHFAIEFAGIWVDSFDFQEISRHESLILPYSDVLDIDQKALDSNGITLEEIAEQGVDLSDLVLKIIDNTDQANAAKMRGKKCVVVGQNVQFDIGFLQQIFRETKQDLSKYFSGSKDYYGNFQPDYIDTLHLGRTKHSTDLDKVNFNLSSLCQYSNIDLVNSHRAMADTESTKELFINYMKSLRTESQDSSTYNYRQNFRFQI